MTSFAPHLFLLGWLKLNLPLLLEMVLTLEMALLLEMVLNAWFASILRAVNKIAVIAKLQL